MKQKYLNQNGASVLMLAMFFIIVITLITVGFATLAQREQRATLDKTLSKQAEYAAESGINAVRNYVNQRLAIGAAIAENNDCTPNAAVFNAASNYVAPNLASAGGSGIGVSCLTWDSNPTEYQFTLGSYANGSFNNRNQTGYSTVSWTTNTTGPSYAGMPLPTQLPAAVVSNNNSILKIVNVIRGDINTVPSRAVTAYLVPVPAADYARVVPAYTTPTSGCENLHPTETDYVDLGNACLGTGPVAATDGLVYYVPCTGNTCSVHIAGYTAASAGGAAYNDRIFYFQNIGDKSVSVTYASIICPYGIDDPLPAPTCTDETKMPLDNVSVKVDSNAIAQDTSKRLVAYIPIDEQTWQPWFGALSESLCKNYKVNGSDNNSAAKGSGGAACPL